MCRGVEARDGILAHQDAADGDVGRGRAHAPAYRVSRIDACTVVEFGENEARGLMCRCFSEHSNGEAGDADGVQDDGRVVEIS